MRTNSLLTFLLLLCSSTTTTVAASKLRGTRTASISNRELNDEEKLLFTEGRKGGDGKGSDRSRDSEDYWTSEDGSLDGGSADDKSSGKEESIYDRPAMKISKEGSSGSSKQATKEGGYDSEDESAMKSKEAAQKEEPSYDSSDGSSYDGGSGDSGSSKGSTKGTSKGASKGATKGAKESGGSGAKGGESKDKADKGDKSPRQGDTDEAEAPAATPVDYSQNDSEQVAFVMSQFGLEFTLGGDANSIPQTSNFAEVEAATISYLEEYLELTYGDGDEMVFFDSVAIEATSRRTGGSGGTPFIDFEASLAFQEDSPMIPTNQEVGMTISEALSGTNLATYLFTLAQRLSPGNPFLTTTMVTVYVPDSAATGDGRVASTSTRMSASGIAAAASAAALTLAIGGYLLYKVKNENMDINTKFGGNGYSGGATLAGDTYDNTTLEASRSRRADDAHSLDTTLYNDDHSFLSSVPAGGLKGAPVANVNKDLSQSPLPSDMDDASEMTYELSPAPTDERDNDSIPSTKAGAYSSIVGRTKALVPSLKAASPMSNKQIKNYFKSKYKCSSPSDYEAVGETVNTAESQESPVVVDAEAQGDADTVRESSLDLLDLPALDHDVVDSPQRTILENDGGRVEESMADYSIPEGDLEVFYDEVSVDDSQMDESSSVNRLVAASQLVSNAEIDKTDAVPRFPDEIVEEDDGRSQGAASVDKSLDDVSLM